MSHSKTSDLSGVAEREKIAALFAQSPISMAILVGAEHRFDFVNSSFERIVGRKNLGGKRVAEGLPDISSEGFLASLDRVYER